MGPSPNERERRPRAGSGRIPFRKRSAMSFTGQRYDFHDQAGDYARLADELGGLLRGESDFVANAANTAALIYDALPDLNWAGFYFLKQGELVVGPFQGKPACVR